MSESPAEATAPSPPESRPLADLYAGTLDCVHCGLCLPACPTYRATGRENSSPRGRIYLMRGVAEGKIPLGDHVAEEAYLCLGCRACETACPSGVRFGHLIEGTRAAVERAELRTGWAKTLESLALRHVVPYPRRIAALVAGLGWSQHLRLDVWVSRWLPEAWRRWFSQAPRVPPRRERTALPERVAARGERRGRVMFQSGCVMPALFGRVHTATLRVLAENGFEVVVPAQQGCCGALHAHAGDPDSAAALARSNLTAFESDREDAIITNSAGCGAALREVDEWLPGDARAAAFAIRVRDVCEFLDAVGLREPSRPLASGAGQNGAPARICYDDPCHLVHGQGVRDAPRRILAAIPGVELVRHAEPETCCGAAGIYNLTHPDMSQRVLDRKLDALAAADPDWIASGNPGCLMQLERGVRERGLRARVAHPVELLAQGYGY